MAVAFARSEEVIDVRPLGPALADWETTALLETGGLEVVRLIVPRGAEIPTHKTRGDVTVHCVEGRVAFTAGDVARELWAGQLLDLQGAQSHSILGIEDASLLMTIVLPRGSAPSRRYPAEP
jgi:quercetin dioxygenase-like cupin family protein